MKDKKYLPVRYRSLTKEIVAASARLKQALPGAHSLDFPNSNSSHNSCTTANKRSPDRASFICGG